MLPELPLGTYSNFNFLFVHCIQMNGHAVLWFSCFVRAFKCFTLIFISISHTWWNEIRWIFTFLSSFWPFLLLLILFISIYSIAVIATSIVGSTSWYPFVDGWTLYIHIRSTFSCHTSSAFRGLDIANKISSTSRLRHIWVSGEQEKCQDLLVYSLVWPYS